MQLRSLLVGMSVVAATSLGLALGQEPASPLAPEAVTRSVRNAGVYHLNTGTWTRTPGGSAAFGMDTIYQNTAPSGYFSTVAGQGGGFVDPKATDEGGLPGSMNPAQPSANRDRYLIDGLEIGYCDLNTDPNVAGWRLSFYESYTPCTDPTTASTPQVLELSGLPSNGCWIVTVDLEGTGSAICLGADGGDASPGFDGDLALDSFGWSIEYDNSLSGSGLAGFLLASDPVATDPGYVASAPGAAANPPTAGTGTYFGAASLCGGVGSGYLTQDNFFVQEANDPTSAGCFFFGGYRSNNAPGNCGTSNPFASFHLALYSQPGVSCDPPCPGVTVCTSNPNSTGAVGALQVCGSASANADNVQLIATSLPANTFGFFITSRTEATVNMPPGSAGVLCLGGLDIGRFVSPGQVKSSGAGGEIRLDTRLGEWSIDAIPTPTGSTSAMAWTSTSFQLWYRDTPGGATVSNFTDASRVLWTP